MDKDFIETKNSKEKITEENTKAYNAYQFLHYMA